MRRAVLLAILFLSLACFGLMAAETPNGCLKCHKELGDEPSKLFLSDVHYGKGITCAGCHGGDPSSEDMDAAMDPKKGYIGVPKKADISRVCLSCHGDAARMASFKSSINAGPFKLFQQSVHGKPDIATCFTCHGAPHQILSTRDPNSPVFPTKEVETCAKCHSDTNYMRQFNPGLPTDQHEKYLTSVHGQRLKQGDTKVATCSACHGQHDIFPPRDPASHVYHLNVPKTCARCHSDEQYMKEYKIPTDQYQKYMSSVHADALLKRHDMGAPACNDCHGNHGATPPGVVSIYHVCGSCHPFDMDNFSQSPHAAAFEKQKLTPCITCHSNHGIQHPTDELLDSSKGAFLCGRCHKPGDPGNKAAGEMHAMIARLDAEETRADNSLSAAEDKGMDVSDARFQYKDIQEALIKSRTMTHKASAAEVRKILEPGLQLSAKVTGAGRAALKEYSFRRWGLGISTLFITLLAVALYLKIRTIERRN